MWLLLYLTTLGLASARLESGVVRLSGEGIDFKRSYLAKFGYAIGQGHVSASFRIPGSDAVVTGLRLALVLDEHVDDVLSMSTCDGPKQWRDTEFSASDRWSRDAASIDIIQRVRPHIWYLFLYRCGPDSNTSIDVEWEVVFVQPDGSELSVELTYMPAATALIVCLLTVFLSDFIRKCKRLREQTGSVHTVILYFGCAVVLQWMAQAMYLSHLVFHERRGDGASAAEALAGHLSSISHVVISILLVMIAQGYTLTKKNLTDMGSIRFFALLVGLTQSFAVGYGQASEEHYSKHHEHQGLAGVVVLVFRLTLWLQFAFGVRALEQKGGTRMQFFAHRFQLAGSLHFLSYPVLHAVVQLLAQYLRHPFFEIGLACQHIMCAFWLSGLFFNRNAYYEISSLRSSLLPGGSYRDLDD